MKRILYLFLFIPILSFGQNEKLGSLKIQEENGLYGLTTETGEIFIEIKFKTIEETCGYFICTTIDNSKQLLSQKGKQIIVKGLKDISINCRRPNIIIGTALNGEINIYNPMGEIISPISFSDIPKYNNYSEESDKLVMTKMDGENCLLDFSNNTESQISIKIIEKPRGHNSARIITYLPEKDGVYFKQVSLNNEKFLSEPIYSDICFDPDCILKYKDKIDVRATKTFFAKAVGILPDMNIHVYSGDGTILNH
jgi:hypothetical protein